MIRKHQLIIRGVAGSAYGYRDEGTPHIDFLEADEAAQRVNDGTPFVDLTEPGRADHFLSVIPRAPNLRFRAGAERGEYAEIPDYIAFWAAIGARTSLSTA